MCMEESQGMNYIVSAIDYFTKYCELGALPNKGEFKSLCGYMRTYSAGNTLDL